MTVEDKLDHIIGEQAKLSNEVGRISAEVGKISSEVTRIGHELTKTRGDIMQRLDRQANAITAIKDDIGVNMARIERSIASNQQISAEVAQQWRQISRLRTEVDDLRGPL